MLLHCTSNFIVIASLHSYIYMFCFIALVILSLLLHCTRIFTCFASLHSYIYMFCFIALVILLLLLHCTRIFICKATATPLLLLHCKVSTLPYFSFWYRTVDLSVRLLLKYRLTRGLLPRKVLSNFEFYFHILDCRSRQPTTTILHLREAPR